MVTYLAKYGIIFAHPSLLLTASFRHPKIENRFVPLFKVTTGQRGVKRGRGGVGGSNSSPVFSSALLYYYKRTHNSISRNNSLKRERESILALLSCAQRSLSLPGPAGANATQSGQDCTIRQEVEPGQAGALSLPQPSKQAPGSKESAKPLGALLRLPQPTGALPPLKHLSL